MQRKNPDKFYENKPNYQKCNSCSKWKQMEEYYFQDKKNGVRFKRCAECQRDADRAERELKLSQTCGSERVKVKPNTWTDIYQKECTFNFLQLLGYIYNEEAGVWLKPGYKELINGKIVFPTLGKTIRKVGHKVTTNDILTMEKLHNEGWSYEEIAEELQMSDTTVWKYMNRL
jgi:hypothetical protein